MRTIILAAAVIAAAASPAFAKHAHHKAPVAEFYDVVPAPAATSLGRVDTTSPNLQRDNPQQLKPFINGIF